MANQNARSDDNSVKALLGRSTTVSTETAAVQVNPSTGAIQVETVADSPGTGANNIGKAEDSPHASGHVGIETLGVRTPTSPTAQTDAPGDYGTFAIDSQGYQIYTPFASTDYDWIANPVTLTTTTATALKAAAAAGIRNYITDIDIANTSATAVRVDFLDGATVIRSFQLAAGAHLFRPFSKPIKGTAATPINVQLSAAVTDVRVSANGYIGL